MLGSAGPVTSSATSRTRRWPAPGTTSRSPTSSPASICCRRNDDINANFSTNFNFYLGLDNNHGPLNDLVAVLLHEFAHGLGFSQTASLTTGALFGGFPDHYNSKLLDTALGLLLAADDQRAARSRRRPASAASCGTASA